MDTGLVVMTRPARNALVGNDVRESTHGIVTAGADSYVADNVLVDNRVALKIGSRSSRYEGNVLARNDVGVTAANFVASNRVVGNDFLDNDDHVRVVAGPRRVWSAGGRGNYWDTADAGRGGVVAADRPYSPTDAVTADLHRPGHLALARSPAYLALEALRGAVPGMRDGGVVDESPAPEPVTGSPIGRNHTDEPVHLDERLPATDLAPAAGAPERGIAAVEQAATTRPTADAPVDVTHV
jgi:nitrous oxidase accessory protein NosD